ncbi:MAG: SagB/ThcOx family dehydrogenase [Thermodesulfobacteriaceae bacterium]|nr:SagB/ThcOx family dehydrogenase [Thermodesulfobacteriaceae bacterium]MCX8042141.1 SagB/ThcOx family dehydrogenase [Thermodesulfobacteriaceae bacterium]MDW8136320.1 SagB/ThcOx family dehydrogenase [Thermodesulfobacterium sp.]
MALKQTIAYSYLKATNLSLERLGIREVSLSSAPRFKEYPEASKVKLSLGDYPKTKTFFEILEVRRSERDYRKKPISLREIAWLCYAVQGVTAVAGTYLLRTAPSAGALYPIETYLGINFSTDIKPGIYHLEVRTFSLELLKEGYFGKELANLALGQSFLATASVVFIWSAVLRRTLSKYGSRGLRYIFMDCAHICQNLLLASEALELKACPVGAFLDEDFNEFLGLDGEEESVIYLATVGK